MPPLAAGALLVAGALWAGGVAAAEPTTAETVLDLMPEFEGSARPKGFRVFDDQTDARFGLEYELTYNPRRNLDLDSTEPDRRDRLSQEIKLSVDVLLGEHASVLLSVKGVADRDLKREGREPSSESAVERDDMWLQIRHLGGEPLSFQIGRIPLSEERTWWWDESLDAFRLTWRGEATFLDTGLGREIARVSNREEHIDKVEQGIGRWFGRAGYVWRPRHAVELFWLHAKDGSDSTPIGQVIPEEDADESDATLNWVGARLSGEERMADGMRIRYWGDVASVRGTERISDYVDSGTGVANQGDSIRKVRGTGFDVGASWTLGATFSPTVTAAYALGTGDSDDSDGVDGTFRQTGLNENKVRFRGVTRFRRYGEVFRPQLSNLSVSTVGLGARPIPSASIDVVWHRFFLMKADGRMPDSRLNRDPDGLSKELGSEVDLILGWRAASNVDLALRYGVFKAGRAFGTGQGETARNLEATLNLEF